MKPIPGYERYKACENGDIIGVRGWILSSSKSNNGYVKVSLSNDRLHRVDGLLAHRVIAATFLGLDLMDSKTEVNHRNGIKSDNRLENLEVCTRTQNRIHSHTYKYPEDTDTHKECRKCHISKPISEFHKSTVNSDGLKSYCKSCRRG